MGDIIYNLKKIKQNFGWTDLFSMTPSILTKNMGALVSKKYGRTFHIRPHTKDFDTFRQVFFLQQYNIPINFNPSVIIDGGANIGLAALYFNWRFPDAKILTYEVEPSNFEQLKNIINHNCAIWNKDTYIEIRDEGNGEDSYMVIETQTKSSAQVKAISIDSIMQANGLKEIDILKLDIEGAEKEVFEIGYENWLPKTRLIIVEVHDNMKQGCSKALFTTMAKYNFSLSLKDENLVFLNNDFLPNH
jgi:FkbM family methyltransferase